MDINNLEEAKRRINGVEKAFLDTIVEVSDIYSDLTTEEIGAAMLRILQSMNDDEINKQCK
jgi:hypothetical protein